jgi:hypothetical protein
MFQELSNDIIHLGVCGFIPSHFLALLRTCVILKRYVHMQGSFCLTLTLILETQGNKIISSNKLFVKSQEDIECFLER